MAITRGVAGFTKRAAQMKEFTIAAKVHVILSISVLSILFAIWSMFFEPVPSTISGHVLAVKNISPDGITLNYKRNVISTAPYQGGAGWTLNCEGLRTIDLGGKTVYRLKGEYALDTDFNVPITVVDRYCSLDTLFIWMTKFSITQRSSYLPSLHFVISKDGQIRNFEVSE